MRDIPTSKIEKRAINTLEYILDKSSLLDYKFNSDDKEVAWDGFITLYKSTITNKKNYGGRIPVQIKGHVDSQGEYRKKQYISYAVSISDLEIYFTEEGVLYFQIFLSQDGERNEVFYASLFPSKIKTYLEKAKNNKNTININFTKLDKDPNEIYRIVKQFLHESKKQGPGLGQLVPQTVPIAELNNSSRLTFTSVDADSELDLLKQYSNGDIAIFYYKI